MKWITREHVGIDRMASAWLITRFIDPDAEFSFVAEHASTNTIRYPESLLTSWGFASRIGMVIARFIH